MSGFDTDEFDTTHAGFELRRTGSISFGRPEAFSGGCFEASPNERNSEIMRDTHFGGRWKHVTWSSRSGSPSFERVLDPWEPSSRRSTRHEMHVGFLHLQQPHLWASQQPP